MTAAPPAPAVIPPAPVHVGIDVSKARPDVRVSRRPGRRSRPTTTTPASAA
jgi:hypothetical protein